jgi:uncharacterized lipoprotein YajG
MKTKNTVVSLCGLVILWTTLTFSGCKGDKSAEESDEKVFMNKLSRSWSTSVVSVDGQDVTGAFTGMRVTFSQAKSITVQNAVPPIWNNSNTFELIKAGTTFSLHRNDGLLIMIQQLSDSQLVMRFVFDADGGRLSSVSGNFTFTMVPG